MATKYAKTWRTPQQRQEYMDYLQSQPGYQTKLEQIQQDYTPKGWIKSPVRLPRFTDEEFEAQRKKYQEKYGSKINPPEFDDIFQWNAPPSISTEEYAAHKYAQQKGLPSPLDNDQLKYLQFKKMQFLKILQSPEPKIMRDIGEIITCIDAAEQALNSAYVLGRLALRAAPELLKGIVPVLGWAALAYDTMNLFDIYTQVGTAKYAKKRLMETMRDKNPFSEKSWARRAQNLQKTWPTLGEFIQLAHTTDHMFGIGLSLGATMAFINDTTMAGMEQIAQFGANVAVTIQHPTAWETIWGDALKTGSALWASRDVWDIALPETLSAAGSMAAKALFPKWINEDPLDKITNLNMVPFYFPKMKNLPSIDNVWEIGIDPYKQMMWPQTDEPALTIDEITDLYAPKIKDNFQTYALVHQNSLEGWLVGQQVTDFNNTMIMAFADDHEAQIADVADVAAAKNMARAGLAIGPGSPQDAMQKLSDWINQYERETGGAPSAKEIKYAGTLIGIKWAREPQTPASPPLQKLFPNWGAVQDQIGKIYTPDSK